jgi:hypothetical protein
MRLELAVVVSCTENDCVVRSIQSDTQIDAEYSNKVRGRIRIEPGQLVAITRETEPPLVVWRWVPVKVDEIAGDRVIVSGEIHKKVSVANVLEAGLELKPGDEAWVCGTPSDKELHDKIAEGKPENPDRLLAYIQPTIEEIYMNAEDL